MNQPSPDTADLAACLHRAVWQLSRQLRSSIHHEGLGAARASALARFQQAYAASAQVMKTADELFQALVATVNGIAAGVQNTG